MKLFQQEPPQADPRWLPGGQDELQSARLRTGGLHRQGEGVRARQGDEDSTPAPTFFHIILLNSFYVRIKAHFCVLPFPPGLYPMNRYFRKRNAPDHGGVSRYGWGSHKCWCGGKK